MKGKDSRVVIATGGQWGPDDHALIAKDDFVIGVDGGNDELLQRNITPHLAVGDFDTAQLERVEALRSLGVPVEQLPRDKDVTDTDYAVTKALQRQPKEVLLLGAWGTRWDHTLANVNLLERIERAGVRGVMQNHLNRMELVGPGQHVVRRQHYHYMSMIAWQGAVKGIHLSGFRFPLVDATLERMSSLAISNEWIGESGTVKLREGKLLIIQSRDLVC